MKPNLSRDYTATVGLRTSAQPTELSTFSIQSNPSIIRHSRESGNPDKVHAPLGWLKSSFLKFHPDWIPAYAGMTEVDCE
jgi:hypothetical protein